MILFSDKISPIKPHNQRDQIGATVEICNVKKLYINSFSSSKQLGVLINVFADINA